MTPSDCVDRLAKLDTTTVSEALSFLSLLGATVGLRTLWNCPKIVGRATTIQLGPNDGTIPTMQLISPVTATIDSGGRVLMIASGSDGVSCLGDILPMLPSSRAYVAR